MDIINQRVDITVEDGPEASGDPVQLTPRSWGLSFPDLADTHFYYPSNPDPINMEAGYATLWGKMNTTLHPPDSFFDPTPDDGVWPQIQEGRLPMDGATCSALIPGYEPHTNCWQTLPIPSVSSENYADIGGVQTFTYTIPFQACGYEFNPYEYKTCRPLTIVSIAANDYCYGLQTFVETVLGSPLIHHMYNKIQFFNGATRAPTSAPSAAPTFSPTDPTNHPTNAPSVAPSLTPSFHPSFAPVHPTISPTEVTQAPSIAPSIAPSTAPSNVPSNVPSLAPSIAPTIAPTIAPSITPSIIPSIAPIQPPTIAPIQPPSLAPSISPSLAPSLLPSRSPTDSPTNIPTKTPTSAAPTTLNPTKNTGNGESGEIDIDTTYSIDELIENENKSNELNVIMFYIIGVIGCYICIVIFVLMKHIRNKRYKDKQMEKNITMTNDMSNDNSFANGRGVNSPHPTYTSKMDDIVTETHRNGNNTTTTHVTAGGPCLDEPLHTTDENENGEGMDDPDVLEMVNIMTPQGNNHETYASVPMSPLSVRSISNESTKGNPNIGADEFIVEDEQYNTKGYISE